MKKTWKRLCTGFLALATVVTALPTTPVHAESKQYWTESAERVGIIEKVMNDGSISSTFNEGMMKVEGETAYAVLIEGKLYKKNEVVKTIHTDIEGVVSTSADLLPYGKFRIVESEAPNGYLADGAKPIDFAITENGKIFATMSSDEFKKDKHYPKKNFFYGICLFCFR